MKLKATIEVIYEVENSKLEDWYNTKDPRKAAEIDQSKFDNDLGTLVDFIQNNDYVVKVEPLTKG